MIRNRYGLVAGLVVVLAAAVGCGGGPGAASGQQDSSASSVYQQLNNLPPDQQRAKAVELAKQEGTLSLYTSYNSDVLDRIEKEFHDQFGIDVQAYRAHSETIAQRIQQESKAGRLGADAVETNFLEMAILSDSKVFAKYTGAQLKRVPEAGKFGDWEADRFNVFVPTWNTNVIKPGQAPRSWADLADPRFNGKIVLERGDYDWFAALTLYWRQHGKSQQQIDKLWHDIVDGAAVSKGHTTVTQLLAAGQTGVFASEYSYIGQEYVDKGAPLSYRPATGESSLPAFARPQGVGILKGAQHPAAAWLFADWLLSPEGQKALVDAGISVSTDVPGNDAIKGLNLAKFPVKAVHEDGDKWSKRYDALLRGVPKQGS